MRRIMMLILILAWSARPTLGCETPTLTPQQAGFSVEGLDALDAHLRQLVDSHHVPGFVTLLARHGRIVRFTAYGEADPDRHVPLRKDSIFRIYSQTKVVTGVALMKLFEQGKWHFDDPVTRFIPEFKSLKVLKGMGSDGQMEFEELKRAPSMRELLTHAAGFGYGLSADSPLEKAYWDANFMASPNTGEAIRRLAGLPLASQPGLHWRYSAAADIQGYIVERLSGMTLRDFMKHNVFSPLHMDDTDFFVPAAKSERFVALKAYDPGTHSLSAPHAGPLLFDYSRSPGTASGGAGLVSTSCDYWHFAQMLAEHGAWGTERVLAPATVDLLSANHLAEDIRNKPGEPFGAGTGVGFGVDVAVFLDPAKAGSLRPASSYDWGGAAGTWFWVDPKNDIVFIGMIQVMERWQDPELANIDKDTATLLYAALGSGGRQASR
jgi:CubicO group peptidase (beta-lactamase class C family)